MPTSRLDMVFLTQNLNRISAPNKEQIENTFVFSLFFYIYNTYKGKSKIKSRCIRWGSSSIVYMNATCLFVKYISFRTMTRIAEIFQKGKKCKLKNYTRSRHRKTRKCTNTLNYKVKHKPRKEMKEKILGYRQH